jgi:hypothetical protein
VAMGADDEGLGCIRVGCFMGCAAETEARLALDLGEGCTSAAIGFEEGGLGKMLRGVARVAILLV